MQMDSKKLAARIKQPGHDRGFLEFENNFIVAARRILGSHLEIKERPSDLKGLFVNPNGRDLGVIPEASIRSPRPKRVFFIEVKNQGASGNAEERAAKHHTVQFYKTLKEKYGYNFHPYVTIFCGHLALLDRYTIKFQYLFEQNQYF